MPVRQRHRTRQPARPQSPRQTLPRKAMVLFTVFITYNRLHLTKQAIESFLATVTVPFTYFVVDNNSEDGTQDWLAEENHPALLLPKNHYPGYATNRGWEHAPLEATYLQRADNDMAFLPGWCDEVQHCFRLHRVAQVGLRTGPEENFCSMNVGGCNILRKELFDRGLRYDERPWTQFDPGMSEDSYFSPEVRRMGYGWTRVRKPCLQSLASGDMDDPYYVRSYGDRRISYAKKGTK